MLGTFAGALDARKINAKEGRLSADVRGEVEEEDKVLIIRRVHVTFLLRAANPDEVRETVDRVHSVYADSCPGVPLAEAGVSDYLQRGAGARVDVNWGVPGTALASLGIQVRRYNLDVRLMHRTIFCLSCSLLICCVLFAAASAQTNPQPALAPTAAQTVPVIDGEAGPCSVAITVTTDDGKPAGAATVKVHIAYGFGGFHKLDLQAGTNSDGKVTFTGLPSRVRRSLLTFEASKDQLLGTATYDPATECQAKREIKLEKAESTGNR